MNELEKKLLIDHAHLDWDDLPVAVREQIDASPLCKQAWKQSRSVQQLMALKRHEQPAGEVAGRIQYTVRTRLENLDDQPYHDAAENAGWAWLKFALAALVVALVSINVLIQVEKNRTGDTGPDGGALIAKPDLGPFDITPTTNTLPGTTLVPVIDPPNQGGIRFIDNK